MNVEYAKFSGGLIGYDITEISNYAILLFALVSMGEINVLFCSQLPWHTWEWVNGNYGEKVIPARPLLIRGKKEGKIRTGRFWGVMR
jgi:hypothetical protein